MAVRIVFVAQVIKILVWLRFLFVRLLNSFERVPVPQVTENRTG
jgi:hypothetical protein